MSLINTLSSLNLYDIEFKALLEKQKSKHRIKERPIKDAVLLVLKWRQMWVKTSGEKISLKKGAEIIGVAKKSLDDYLLQLRLGKKYGFEFQRYSDEKIGVLRSYNRQMKKKMKEMKFAPGRKRKEEEEDYTEMVLTIMDEIHNNSKTNICEQNESFEAKNLSSVISENLTNNQTYNETKSTSQNVKIYNYEMDLDPCPEHQPKDTDAWTVTEAWQMSENVQNIAELINEDARIKTNMKSFLDFDYNLDNYNPNDLFWDQTNFNISSWPEMVGQHTSYNIFDQEQKFFMNRNSRDFSFYC